MFASASPASLPSSLLPVLLSSPERREKTTVWEEGEGRGENGGGSSDLQIIYLRLASA